MYPCSQQEFQVLRNSNRVSTFPPPNPPFLVYTEIGFIYQWPLQILKQLDNSSVPGGLIWPDWLCGWSVITPCLCFFFLPLLLRCERATDRRWRNQYGHVPIKLKLQSQVVGWIWFMGWSLPAPGTVGTELKSFSVSPISQVLSWKGEWRVAERPRGFPLWKLPKRNWNLGSACFFWWGPLTDWKVSWKRMFVERALSLEMWSWRWKWQKPKQEIFNPYQHSPALYVGGVKWESGIPLQVGCSWVSHLLGGEILAVEGSTEHGLEKSEVIKAKYLEHSV